MDEKERPTLRASLKPHQQEGLEWLLSKDAAGHGGGIIADDMGLGKTLLAIAYMLRTYDADRGPSIVICPKGLLRSVWLHDILKHTTARADQVCMYFGPKRSWKKFHAKKTLVVLTTYDMVMQDYNKHKSHLARPNDSDDDEHSAAHALFRRKWASIVLDEAHRLRNGTTQTTAAVLALKAHRKFWLTGTPINNGSEDILPACQFIGDLPYSTTAWWQKHKDNADALKRWRDNYLLRREKSVLNLPPVYAHTIQIVPSEEENSLNQAILEEAARAFMTFQAAAGTEESQLFTSMLAWMTRLRLVCCHPMLLKGRAWTRQAAVQSSAPEELAVRESCIKCHRVKFKDGHTSTLKELACQHYACNSCWSACYANDPNPTCHFCKMVAPWVVEEKVTTHDRPVYKESSKSKAVGDYCQSNLASDPTAKFVVFCEWTAGLDMLEAVFADRGLRAVRYDGDVVSLSRREQILAQFSDDPTCNVLLISLQTGSVGLNLVAANHVVFFNDWYNPFVQKQAQDRLNRIGQTRPVHVVRFCVKGSIEEDIQAIQANKIREATFVLTGIGSFVKPMTNGVTKTDIQRIFRRISQVFSIKESAASSNDRASGDDEKKGTPLPSTPTANRPPFTPFLCSKITGKPTPPKVRWFIDDDDDDDGVPTSKARPKKKRKLAGLDAPRKSPKSWDDG